MLFAEFAVNPGLVTSIERLALLKTNFDFSRGSLISAFPKRWYAEVFDNLSPQLSDQDKSKAVVLLNSIKNYALVKSERDYEGAAWAEAVSAAHQRLPFYCIVGSDDRPPQQLSSFEQLYNFDFERVGSIDVLRQARNLIEPLSPLLRGSSKLRLVDPYLCPSNPHLQEVITTLVGGYVGRRFEIEIYSDERRASSDARAHFKRLVNELQTNISLSWFLLADDGSAKLHQRLFFTEKGGVIFDRGFIVPNPHEQRQVTTNLRTMTKTQIDNATRDYNDTQPLLPCVLRLSSVDAEFRS